MTDCLIVPTVLQQSALGQNTTDWQCPLFCSSLHWDRIPVIAWLCPLFCSSLHWHRIPLTDCTHCSLSSVHWVNQEAYSVDVNTICRYNTHHINHWLWRQMQSLKCWICNPYEHILLPRRLNFILLWIFVTSIFYCTSIILYGGLFLRKLMKFNLSFI